MSSEESDDEFESADEEIDFEPTREQRSKDEKEDLNESKAKNVDRNSGQFDKQLNLTSVENRQIKSIVPIEESDKSLKSTEPTLETPKKLQQPKERVEIKLKDNKTDIKGEEQKTDNKGEEQKTDIKGEEQSSNDMNIETCDENKAKEVKPLIKGRKILRKADRLREQTTCEESPPEDEGIGVKVKEQKTEIKAKEQKADIKEEDQKIDIKKEDQKIDIKEEEQKIDIKEEEQKTDIKTEEQSSNDMNIETCDENNAKEIKPLIKGRKLLRKADRLREQTTSEESLISEEKKMEVLSKLSDLSEREDTSNKWNNWFSDIKSAAMTASSTTVSHVTQASNKWSLNPKSLLTSAVSITSNVGSGISSVVENVSSVMDSAIGAPPPEQMAALTYKDIKVEEKPVVSDQQNTKTDENQSKSSLGFGLFDYTFNTESIGKKTMEVIVDDKHKKDIKYDKND